MKWIRFTLDTHTEAVDILSYKLNEIGVEGIEVEDQKEDVCRYTSGSCG